MKKIDYVWQICSIFAILFAVQGCGLKPERGVPVDITLRQALSAIERQSNKVDTFSGTASVKFSVNGNSETATLLVRYIEPGLSRIYLKGFAGIDMGRISVLEDSITVYIPPENLYLKAGRDEKILEKLFPEMELNVNTVELLFNVTMPPEDSRDNFEISMKHVGDKLELSMVNGNVIYRYLLAGPELHLTHEEYLVNNTIVWRKTLSDYKSYDGVEFPQEIKLERGDDSVTVNFSNCEINTGITASDLTFAIPLSAERVYIENSR